MKNTINVLQTEAVVKVQESPTIVKAVETPSKVIKIVTAGPQGPGGELGLYANLIDTTDQAIASTASAQAVTLNTVLDSRGITVVDSSKITFELSGVYKILVSLQITNSSNTLSEVDIFFKKNGTIIANSNTRIDIQPRKSVSVPYHECFTIEFQLDIDPSDYVQIFWASEHLGVSLDTIPLDALHPQAPSAIVNVAQVLFAQAGVPVGGAAGDLLVKNSSTNYDTAWTDSPTVDKLAFDTAAAESVTTGQIAWNNQEGTIDIGTPGVTYQVGQELSFLCKNATANTIANGTAVMFAGADSVSGYIEIAPVIANGTLPGYVFFGVTTQSISAGDNGYVTTLGKVRGLDTSAYPDDSILWLSPTTPGTFQLTEPPAPALKVPAAAVIKSDATNGVIFVRADIGRRIQDCHDVDLGPGAADREYLGWSEAIQAWTATPIPNAAPRSATILGPKSGDNLTLFRTDVETTLASVIALVAGTSPGVTYEIRYASNRSSAGTLAISPATTTSTTTGSSATVINQPIPANSYVWLAITAVTGTVGEMNVTLAF
jgi:hypothetical protein